MPSISDNLKTAFRVGYMCVILLIPKTTSNLGSSNNDIMPINHLADSSAVGEVVGKITSPVEDPSMGSEKNQLLENVNNFEKHPNDPFVQEVIRVGSDEEDLIELSNLSRKKKFLWFQYGNDESGETRFRTLHGKNYNPYDFDEYDNLNANQYKDKLISKTGAKVEKAKAKPETKPEASSPKVEEREESLKQQPNSDPEENLQKPRPTTDQQMLKELPINGDKPAKMEGAADETFMKEFAKDTDQRISDTQNSQMTESQLSLSSTMTKPQMQIMEDEPRGSSEKVKEKRRGRKKEDSLMLEFAHNRPDSRILWLNNPDYRSIDEYRLIDEAAERTLITYREFGFVNTDIDSMKAVEEFITYVENNKIGKSHPS